MYTNIQSLR